MSLRHESLNKYKYQGLSGGREIRLLKLFPGSKGSELKCDLEIVNIDTDIDDCLWSAISYCWATEYWPDRPFLLRCDSSDTERSTFLEVSRTLFNLLTQLQDEETHRYLWIDAICINQSNVVERSQQVNMMGEIYGKANQVIVWLGPEDGRTQAVFAAFELLVSMRTPENPQGMENVMAFGSIDLEEFDRVEPAGGPSLTRDMLALFDRPWFSRAWVLQEVGLGSNVAVLCGSQIIKWQTIGTAVIFFNQKEKSLVEHLKRSADVNRAFHLFTAFRREQTPGTTKFQFLWDHFLYVLDNARPYLATEPRDKVYSLLAHWTARTKEGTSFIEPDYSRSLLEVYREVTLRMIAKTDSLEVLSAVQHDPGSILQKDCKFPTWVPRWDQYYNCQMLGRYTSKHFAGGNSPASIIPVDDIDVLKVQGILFNRTCFQSDVLKSANFNLPPMAIEGPNPVAAIWIAWGLDQIENNCYPRLAPPSSPSLWAAYYSTFTAGMTDPPDGYDMLEPAADFNAYWVHLFENEYAEIERSENASAILEVSRTRRSAKNGDWRRFREAAAGVCNMRRVFMTEKAFLGLGPAVMQKDDIVAVLSGSDTPTVLRRCGRSRYQVIGECYVHGLMQGQARNALRNGALKLYDLELC
ncbi:uncharacterized protein KY384_007234 [Bacidia gigantensis]|uniref:uncharacterized protein n=1 Tax=Bacidia gigantensis TaxID=2732470 RepID=UPI001D040B20|nr:uncharacterized protein KY384_007234 [Bacidia gigantensis]KAG8528317.1 hypothetical protein KY384_007234 [Bacidia gigantensis]